MSAKKLVEDALSLWSSGDREGFKNKIRGQEKKIFRYNGTGDILSYFFPALLIEEFWNDLQDIGFPLEKIVPENFYVLGWLKWDRALNYMINKDRDLIEDIRKTGFYEDEKNPKLFNKSSENYENLMDYFNPKLRLMVECKIDEYLKLNDKDWDDILIKVENILNIEQKK